METNNVWIPSNLRGEVKLTTLNDIHVGSKNCAKREVKQRVNEIAADEDYYWLGLGDYAEWINHRDPRFDPDNIDGSIVSTESLKNLRGTYLDYLTELLWPIRHRCLGLGDGNHEERFIANNSCSLTEDLARNLGVPYTKWACFTEITFKDGNKHADTFVVYHAHGWQAGRKSGGVVNGLDDLMGMMEADIYFKGHSHQYQPKYKVTLFKDGDIVRHRTKVGWHCGSFLRVFQMGSVSYAERKEFAPNLLWTPTVTIHPARDGHGWVE